jgi:SAM-dependent methyltransferase
MSSLIASEREGYDAVSSEYYDASRHPNTAGLTVLSIRLLARLWPPNLRGLLVETGAGRSFIARSDKTRPSTTSALVTDISLRMLSWTNREASGVSLAVARAQTLPVRSEAASIIVASLADAYFEADFLREAHRALAPGGFLLISTPAWEWATWYRSSHSLELSEAARFESIKGRVYVPSHIHEPSKRMSLLNDGGFAIIQTDHAGREALPHELAAHKLRDFVGPLVTAHLCKKI